MDRQRGFTLMELIITVAIAAIVLAIGVPSFQGMMRNNRVIANTNDFLASLNLARSEAIKRASRTVSTGSRVVLCPGTQAGCSGTAWGGGWILFVDEQNNNGVWDAGDQLLRVHGPLAGGDTLTGNTPVSTYISFTADGSARVANSIAFQAGTLTFTLCNSTNQRNTVVINSVGRARVVSISCP